MSDTLFDQRQGLSEALLEAERMPQSKTETPLLSLILPAYQEASRKGEIDPETGLVTHGEPMEAAIYRYRQFFDYELGSRNWDLTVVDDGSTDNTSEFAASLGADVLTYPDGINRGRGAALKLGYQSVRGQVRIYTDSDGSYGPETIMQLFENVADKGYDMAVAHREKGADQHAARLRAMAHIVLHRICENKYLMAPTGVLDPQAGAKALSQEAVDAIMPLVTIEGWAFDRQVLSLARVLDLRVADVGAEITSFDDSRVNPLKDALKMVRDSRQVHREIKHFSRRTGGSLSVAA